MTNDVPISEMLEIWNTPDKTIGTVATIEIPIPPRSVVCLTFFLRYYAVSAPGLIPGIWLPAFFMLSEISKTLKIMLL